MKKGVKITIALSTVAVVAVGAIFGISAVIKAYEQKEYISALQTRYEQVDVTLTEAMSKTMYTAFYDSEVTGIYFEAPLADGATLRVFYEGDVRTNFGTESRMKAAEFNVEYEYYENLVDAEDNENKLDYLDALNDVFANMEFIKEDLNSKITLELPQNTEENIAVFNQIFNVEGLNADVTKQVGFTPYYIKMTEKEIINTDPETQRNTFKYTYKIYGTSYCETNSENSAYVKNSDKTIMSENFDSNHLKAYNRVMTFSSGGSGVDIVEEDLLSGDIFRIINGVNNPYTVTNEYFEEVNVFETYLQMLDGNFDFERPEGLDLSQYTS